MRRRRALGTAIPAPHKPTMRERVTSSAESLAREVVNESPAMVRRREQVKRELARAAMGAVRKVGGGR